MKKVFMAGGTSYDTIIHLNTFPEPKPSTVFSKGSYQIIGETGSGKALNLCRMGFETTLHTVLGSDEAGEKIIEHFKNEEMNFLYDIVSETSSTHTNLMDEHGGRISIYTSYAAFEPNLDYDKFNDLIKSSEFIVLNIINYVRYLIPIAKKNKKEIWCDIHDYDGKNEYHNDFIAGADYIFMSSDLMPDYREFMEKTIENGKKMIICTHGKNGASCLTGDKEWIEVPIIDKYERVDTNGAGDSFFSGVLYGFSKGYDIRKCLQFGTIAGGLCITTKELAFEKMSPEYLESEYIKHYGLES